MACVRCGGFVIIDGYSWLGKEIDRREAPQTHCVNCGWIEDPVIRANRELMTMGRHPHLNVRRVVRGPMGCSASRPGLLGSRRSAS
jgi:hypothetical protein